MLAVLGEVELAQAHPVRQHHPLVGVVEPAEEVDDGRLSDSALADEPDHGVGLNPEGDLLEHRLALLVSEADVSELDLALHLQAPALARAALCVVRRVEHLEDPLRRRHGARHPLGALRQPVQGAVEHREVGEKGHEAPDREPALPQDDAPAEVPDEQGAAGDREADHGEEGGEGLLGMDGGAEEVGVAEAEALDLVGFPGEGLDDLDAPESVVDHGVEAPPPIPELVEGHPHAPPERPREKHDQGRRKQHEDGKLPVDGEDRSGHAKHDDEVAQDPGQPEGEEVLEAPGVLGEAGDERAGRVVVEVAHRHPLEAVVELCSDVEAHPPAEPGGDPAAPHGGAGAEQIAGEQPRHKPDQEVSVRSRDQHVVHQDLREPGGHEPEDGGEDHQEADEGEPPAVGRGVAEEPPEHGGAPDAAGADAGALAQHHAALGAAEGARDGLGDGLVFDGGVELAAHVGELLGEGVRVADEVPLVPVHDRLEDAPADQVLDLELAHALQGKVRLDARRPTVLGHHEDAVIGQHDPALAEGAVGQEVAARAQAHARTRCDARDEVPSCGRQLVRLGH